MPDQAIVSICFLFFTRARENFSCRIYLCNISVTEGAANTFEYLRLIHHRECFSANETRLESKCTRSRWFLNGAYQRACITIVYFVLMIREKALQATKKWSFKAGLLKLWVATPVGVAKCNFGARNKLAWQIRYKRFCKMGKIIKKRPAVNLLLLHFQSQHRV